MWWKILQLFLEKYFVVFSKFPGLFQDFPPIGRAVLLCYNVWLKTHFICCSVLVSIMYPYLHINLIVEVQGLLKCDLKYLQVLSWLLTLTACRMSTYTAYALTTLNRCNIVKTDHKWQSFSMDWRTKVDICFQTTLAYNNWKSSANKYLFNE